MRFRATLVAVIVFGSLVIPPVNASAFTFGSYCIKLSSPGIKWQAPKVGSSEIFRFTFVNSCQKVIPSLQIDFSEDISGGNFSQWNTLGEIFTLEEVAPGQRGNVQISISYIEYISAQDRIYLRAVESESILNNGATNTTNNISAKKVIFSSSNVSTTPSSTSTSNNQGLARGSYSETANDDGAPISSSDIVGNIRRINVIHKSNGALELTVDFWKMPNSNFTTRILWCSPDNVIDLELTNKQFCDANLNFMMFFSPSMSSSGAQAGVRKTFKGTSKKGSNSNQRVYTISGSPLKSSSVVRVEVLMLYASATFTERTTTCRGGYSITCNTRSSNIFERDSADVKLEQF